MSDGETINKEETATIEISPLDEAKKILEEINKSKAELKEEREKFERAKAEQILAGKSVVTPPQKVITQEEKIQEILKERWKDSKVKPF